jgi:hypothetical protein
MDYFAAVVATSWQLQPPSNHHHKVHPTISLGCLTFSLHSRWTAFAVTTAGFVTLAAVMTTCWSDDDDDNNLPFHPGGQWRLNTFALASGALAGPIWRWSNQDTAR